MTGSSARNRARLWLNMCAPSNHATTGPPHSALENATHFFALCSRCVRLIPRDFTATSCKNLECVICHLLLETKTRFFARGRGKRMNLNKFKQINIFAASVIWKMNRLLISWWKVSPWELIKKNASSWAEKLCLSVRILWKAHESWETATRATRDGLCAE